MASQPEVVKLVDAWFLRCVFNDAKIVYRTHAGEFTLKGRPKTAKPSTRPQDPPGSTREHFDYFDKDGNRIATSQYWHFNGQFLTEPDPKSITVGDVRYVIYPDDVTANPEKRLFKTLKWQKRYGCYRKFTCCWFGPDVKFDS